MTVRFDEVPQINAPDNADIFVLKDSDAGTTKYITWQDIRNNILNEEAIRNQIPTIITEINSYEAGGTGTSNSLKANQLWFSGSYREGSYYLNWNNLSNVPTLLTGLGLNDTLDLSQLDNTTGFVRVNTDRLVYKLGQGTSETLLTTDRLNEGGQNLYYTDARVLAKIESTFPDQLSKYTSSFDQGNTANSLTDVPGTWQLPPGVTVYQDQSNVARISTDYTINFNVGQKVRIYGASVLDSALIQSDETNFSFTTAVLGHNTSGSSTTSFSYRASVFDIDTGEIAASFGPVLATIEVPDGYNDDPTSSQFVGNFFNSDKFIELRFANSVESGRGVAIYRQDPNTSEHNLIYVAGPKDLAEIDGFRDYYNFDRVEWATKDEKTNQYTSIIHFPLTAPSQPRRGWVDTQITAKRITDSFVELTFGDSFFFTNSDRLCTIAHNDTDIIQDAITANANVDRKALDLNAKTYVVEQINIPNNFGLNGTPFLTRLKKLPWSGGQYNSSTMIRSTLTTNATNITLVGIDVDGDASNQFLFTDSTNTFNNYAINFFTSPNQPLFDKVRVQNVIGGGVYATDSTELRFTNGEIINSGNTDRWDYSPLVADSGENSIITSNVFRNFTDFVDVSVTDRGVVTSNVIENTGSGLFIYGSKFILSSPNILIGPADEFLPQPDILNSVYDSVNIVLKDAYLAESDFLSDVYVYKENGESFDLTQTDGVDANGNGGISNIEYNVFYVRKDATSGAELFWTPNAVADPVLQPVPQSREEGKFQFRILNSDVERLVEGNLSVPSLRTQQADHQGLAYSVTYENEVRAGVIPPTTNADSPLSGVRDPDSTTGTGLNKVYDTGFGLSTGTVSGNEYAIRVNNMQFLSLGTKVKLNQHVGFVATGNTTNDIGTITYVSNVFPDGEETYVYVSIRFDGTTSFDIGNGGYINIVDKFVMAQGRII